VRESVFDPVISCSGLASKPALFLHIAGRGSLRPVLSPDEKNARHLAVSGVGRWITAKADLPAKARVRLKPQA
jgi:hypothetical protein